MTSVILLNKNKMLALLSPLAKKCLGDIRIEESVTSTNDILLSKIKNHPQKNRVLLAETQTAGRGRLGRLWVSPAHCNIYLSLSWYFKKPVSELSHLSMIIAECIVKALKNDGIPNDITIKYPNDLLYHHKKFCGILIETVGIEKNHTAAVIGIGLNVNFNAENTIIDQPWTSLQQITHHQHDRNAVVAAILNEIIANIKK